MFTVYVFYYNLKEKDHIKINTNSKKLNVYKRNQYYYYYKALPKIRVCQAHATKN